MRLLLLLDLLFLLFSCFAMGLSLQQTDVIVIGGGSAGLTAAKLVAQTKHQVHLIETSRLGGDCTWTGCVPSKSLIALSKKSESDYKLVRQTIQSRMEHIYEADDSPQVLEQLGVTVLSGKASMMNSTTVSIESNDSECTTLQAKMGIILCTGAGPAQPAFAVHTDTLDYESFWDLDKLPSDITIVGAGPIGCEIAQALARLGVRVTLVSSSVLPTEDPLVAERLQGVLEASGVKLVTGRVQQVNENKSVALPDGTTIPPAAAVLIATGRQPRTTGMNLEAIGIDTSNKRINVDDNLQTAVKGVYAAGDCTGAEQFTHYAGYQGAIAARNIVLPFSDPGVLSNVPKCIFTSPEVASIGLDEATARERYGKKLHVAFSDLSHVDRAVCDDAEAGFIKILYLNNGQIVGATIMAPVAGELISEIAVAMAGKMTFDSLAKVMHPYPSYSFAIQVMAAEVYYEKTLKLQWLYNILKRFGL